jgi:Uma2 family endonuclease
MSTRSDPVTADQLLRMPDHGVRRELVAGVLREMNLAGCEHGRVAVNFMGPLHLFVKQETLGAVFPAGTGFLLTTDPDTVLAPDVAFVSRERKAKVPRGDGYFPGPPELAVEVISPEDTYSEVEEKVERWLDAGCRMVVVVNPRNCTLKIYRTRTEVLVLTMQDSFDGGDVLPGFQLPVRQIFEV